MMLLPYTLGMPGLLDTAADWLTTQYGTGHYSSEPWSAHDHYRRGQAFAFAVLLQRAMMLRASGIPGGALESATDWRKQIGYLWPGWTAEEDLAMIEALCLTFRRSASYNATEIHDALVAVLSAICGATTSAVVVTDNPGQVDVQFYAPLSSTSRRQQQAIRWLLWRMIPAHVECYLAWPDEGVGPDPLTAEE